MCSSDLGGGDFVGGLVSRRLPTFFVVAASQAVALLIVVSIAAASGQPIPDGSTALTTAIAGVTGADSRSESGRPALMSSARSASDHN